MRLACALPVAVSDLADLLVDDAVAVGQSQFLKHCFLDLPQVLLCARGALLVGCDDHGGKLGVGKSQSALPLPCLLQFCLQALYSESQCLLLLEFVVNLLSNELAI
jgi:hypothetical protein